MALLSTSEYLSSITERHIEKVVAENWALARPIQARLRRDHVDFPGGTELTVPILTGSEPNVQAFAGTDLIPLALGAPINRARYLMKRYSAQLVIPTDEILVNSGPEAIVDLVSVRRRNLEISLDDMIGTDLITSTGTGSAVRTVEGIENIIDNVTSTGGIGPADLASWSAKVTTTSESIASNLRAIQDGFGAVTIGAEMPTLAATTQTILNQMWQSGMQMQRLVDESGASLGFTALGFNMRPVVVDAGIPANHFLWLNERYLKLHIHKQDNFRAIYIDKLPDQDVSLWRITVTLAPSTDNRRMHFKHTNLQVS